MLVRRAGFFVLALLISGLTAVGTRNWLDARLADARPALAVPVPQALPAKQVLVANVDLPAGQFVRPEHLRWQAWPADAVGDAFVVEGGARTIEDFEGAVVRSGVTAGEPVTEARLVRPGDRGFLAAVLAPGARAVTVPVTPSSGVAGFVFPGDHVDVILTLAIPQDDKPSHERRASETILSDIRILAIDQRADDQKKEVAVPKLATLEVTPKQAEIIAVAGEMGKLSLTLRSLAVADDAPPAAAKQAPSHTWDREATQLLAPPRGPSRTVRRVSVVRGSASSEMEFK
ncbi:MAG TPA: Flp pilus assembly protein CpaB [Stellaceae bacterium]